MTRMKFVIIVKRSGWMNLYDITVKNGKEEEVSLSEYKDKVLLIVNTATKCAFTPQLEGLELLQELYNDLGFEVLAFPCNQFAHQAPGSYEKIESFCRLNYKTSFTTFDKVDVNGNKTCDLYKYLKAQQKGMLGGSIKWNFTKFLISREGKVVKRYAPYTAPELIEADIERLL